METLETSNKENERKRSPNVFACIPAFNQEQSIEKVVRATLKHVDHVIVIDDDSSDNTAELAERAGAIVISHPMNLGYGAAIKSGLLMAVKQKADAIVTLDADLQHNPEEIPSLVNPILDGEAEIVIGSRFLDKKSGSMPSYRKAGIRVITKLTNYDGIAVTDAQSGFRAYSVSALRRIVPYLTSSGMNISVEILNEASKNSCRIAEVPIVVNYDVEQPSRHNPLSHGAGVGYSLVYYIAQKRPLLFVGLPGLVLLSFGLWGIFTLLGIFNVTRQIPSGLGIFTLATTLLGIILILATGILILISQLSKQIRSLKKVSRYD